MKKIILGLILVLFIYLNNASWLRGEPNGELRLLAHRGVHQNYSKNNLSRDACTASRIDAPEHAFLENTLASIEQAFSSGASIVEIDIHPTIDGQFAVFHDWTLDCRTNASGITREQSLAYLQSLDIAYGYTHDGGQTYPFRGQGIAKLPSLASVLDSFPDQKLLINIKSNDAAEADLIAEYFTRRSHENLERLWFYGSEKPISRLRSIYPKIKRFSDSSVKKCAFNYLALGWSSYMPKACRDTIVAIPIDYAHFLWGWPSLFVSRLAKVNSEVILVDMDAGHLTGIDSPAKIRQLAENYRGFVFTDRVEKVGQRER